jgi:hypothetical protein
MLDNNYWPRIFTNQHESAAAELEPQISPIPQMERLD